MSGIQLSRGHCPFSKPSPNGAAISETISICLRLLNPLWRSLDTLPNPIYGPTHAAFPYEWLVLAHASQLLNPILYKQQLISVSSRLSTSDNQPRWPIGLHLRISKPSKSSSCLRFLYSLGRVALGKTQEGFHLGCTTQETPEPMHPVNSYRLCLSTTTLPLHT